MTAQEMWTRFCAKEKVDAEYDAWAFGDQPDVLAQLVLDGVKTATSSLHLFYELEAEPLPEAGQYSVILNEREEAVCVIRNTKVAVVPFDRVTEEQAWREGEGDRSLAYWRKVHEEFFTKELLAEGRRFSPSLDVVCEEFRRVYP